MAVSISSITYHVQVDTSKKSLMVTSQCSCSLSAVPIGFVAECCHLSVFVVLALVNLVWSKGEEGQGEVEGLSHRCVLVICFFVCPLLLYRSVTFLFIAWLKWYLFLRNHWSPSWVSLVICTSFMVCLCSGRVSKCLPSNKHAVSAWWTLLIFLLKVLSVQEFFPL